MRLVSPKSTRKLSQTDESPFPAGDDGHQHHDQTERLEHHWGEVIESVREQAMGRRVDGVEDHENHDAD